VSGSAAAAVSTGAAVALGLKLSLEGSRFEKSKSRSNSALILSLTVSIIQFSKRDRMGQGNDEAFILFGSCMGGKYLENEIRRNFGRGKRGLSEGFGS
jgi:hypothetical protein